MKILLFANTDWYLFNFRLDFARSLKKDGNEVVLISPEGEYTSLLQKEGFRWVCFPMERKKLNPIKEIMTLFRLFNLYRREKPDLVHQFTIKCVLYGSLVCYLLGYIHVINSVEGLGYVFTQGRGNREWIKNVTKFFYRLVLPRTWVIFQNPDDQSFFLKNQLVNPARNIIISGPGVDTRKYVITPETGGIPLVILPARLIWDKGVKEFVEAAQQLQVSGTEARFALVGDCDEGNPASIHVDQLREWAKKGVIEWWGWMQKMEEVYAQVSIVCLPSYYREGLPKSLLEASACGRPIVTTNVPGCREVVRDGENGLLVDAKNVAGLVKALDFLIKNPDIRKKMGVRGREIVEKEYSLEIINPQIYKVYKSCLNDSSNLAT